MDVLKVSHVLADDEQVVLPLVHGLELQYAFAGAWMRDAKLPLRGLASLHDRRFGGELEPVVADVEWRTAHERHAAARTRAGDVERVVRMHRAHEGRFPVE
jgi:hypothetical protein